MYYAICDCDNCFVSCERVFRPDLEKRPVVVLSNNDGCVVSRSPEAKALGVKMGLPYFQLRQRWSEAEVVAFSSNMELYTDMTARVMSIIHRSAPTYFRYSVDEAFCTLPDMAPDEAKEWGEQLAAKVLKCTGMPLSIGIGPNKTLAKIATSFAKKYPGYRKCCHIATEQQRLKALEITSIGDVWGIGRRIVVQMGRDHLTSALQFASKPLEWVKSRFSIVTQRTWRELNGENCVPDEELASNKSLTTSRTFASMTSDKAELRTHVANYAARCAEKLRKQHSVAAVVGVFLATNRHRPDLPQYSNMADYRLPTESDSSIEIAEAALKALDHVYREGYLYKRAGVILTGIGANTCVQPDLFTYSPRKAAAHKRLSEAVDSINYTMGRDTVILGSQAYTTPGVAGKATAFADIANHALRSLSPSTRWSDIITLT